MASAEFWENLVGTHYAMHTASGAFGEIVSVSKFNADGNVCIDGEEVDRTIVCIETSEHGVNPIEGDHTEFAYAINGRIYQFTAQATFMRWVDDPTDEYGMVQQATLIEHGTKFVLTSRGNNSTTNPTVRIHAVGIGDLYVMRSTLAEISSYV